MISFPVILPNFEFSQALVGLCLPSEYSNEETRGEGFIVESHVFKHSLQA